MNCNLNRFTPVYEVWCPHCDNHFEVLHPGIFNCPYCFKDMLFFPFDDPRVISDFGDFNA